MDEHDSQAISENEEVQINKLSSIPSQEVSEDSYDQEEEEEEIEEAEEDEDEMYFQLDESI